MDVGDTTKAGLPLHGESLKQMVSLVTAGVTQQLRPLTDKFQQILSELGSTDTPDDPVSTPKTVVGAKASSGSIFSKGLPTKVDS